MITTCIKPRRNVICLVSIVFIFFISWFSANPYAIAAPSISFQFGGYFLGDGQVGVAPVIITVTDSAANLSPVVNDTVQVHVTSTTDPTGITLTLKETNVNTGILKNTNLIFMKQDYQFPVGKNATFTVTDFAANASSIVVNQLPIKAVSSSDHTGISVIFTETGTNTGVFNGYIVFASSSSSGNTLHVVPGDIFSITDQVSGLTTNGIITPNPDPTVGAIRANIGDTVTATYGSVSSTATIGNDEAPGGGGGGGLIRPGLVLDVVSILDGRGGLRILPPQFTFNTLFLNALPIPEEIKNEIRGLDPFTPIKPLNYSSDDMPLTINGKSYPLTSYASTIVTSKIQTDKPSELKLVFKDYYEVTHVGLYTDVHGIANSIFDSNTYVIYNKGDPLEISDPSHYFSSVNLTRTTSGSSYIFDYHITFARPMNTSDIIIRAWNERHSSYDWKILDAIQIVRPETPSKTLENSISGILKTSEIEPKSKTDNLQATAPIIQSNTEVRKLGDFVPVINMWIG